MKFNLLNMNSLLCNIGATNLLNFGRRVSNLETNIYRSTACEMKHRLMPIPISSNRSNNSYGTSKGATPVRMSYTSFKSTSTENLSAAAPIVIMHGLLGSKTNWKSLGKAISQQTGRIVYTVDARNHGESPHTDSFTYYDMAEDISYFLSEHSITEACVVGHSMGGRAAMAFALSNPNLVEKLFVLDVAPTKYQSNNLSTLPRFVEVMRKVKIPAELKLHEARKYVDQLLLPIIPDAGLRSFLLSNLAKRDDHFFWKVNLDAIAKHFNPHISTFSPAKDGKTFNGITYFIGGALSDYIRPVDHPEIRTLFPKAEFAYVDGAGHWLHTEKPHEFLTMIVPLINL